MGGIGAVGEAGQLVARAAAGVAAATLGWPPAGQEGGGWRVADPCRERLFPPAAAIWQIRTRPHATPATGQLARWWRSGRRGVDRTTAWPRPAGRFRQNAGKTPCNVARWCRWGVARADRSAAWPRAGGAVPANAGKTPCNACHRALVPVVARRWRRAGRRGWAGPGPVLGPAGGSGKMRARPHATWRGGADGGGAGAHRTAAWPRAGGAVQANAGNTPCTACHRALVPVVARRWRRAGRRGWAGPGLASGRRGGSDKCGQDPMQRGAAVPRGGRRGGASDRGLASGRRRGSGKCGQYPMHRLPPGTCPGGGAAVAASGQTRVARGGTCLRIGGAMWPIRPFAPAPRWPAPRLRL